jgi:blue copper oxidase
LLTPLGFAGIVNAAESASWFKNPLGLPPLEAGSLINGKRVINLSLGYGSSAFLGDRPTATVGINGDYLGPVIRVNQGDDVELRVTNNLSEPSTLHWHGLNLPATMDGGPHQAINPGETWNAAFKIHQGACTQWYHSHMYHRTGIQVYYGLAGLFYIDDERSNALDLPSTYGIDDVPLVLQDRSFNQDGSLRYLGSMHDRMMGMMGQVMLVNGTAFARFKVQKRLSRLRILNGSNARIYNLEFGDRREFLQIATEGGLLAHPVALRNIVLAPGERAEVLVEFARGDDVMLQHKPLPIRAGSAASMGMMGNMMAANDRPFEQSALGCDLQEFSLIVEFEVVNSCIRAVQNTQASQSFLHFEACERGTVDQHYLSHHAHHAIVHGTQVAQGSILVERSILQYQRNIVDAVGRR